MISDFSTALAFGSVLMGIPFQRKTRKVSGKGNWLKDVRDR
jgi:hypothetical protein